MPLLPCSRHGLRLDVTAQVRICFGLIVTLWAGGFARAAEESNSIDYPLVVLNAASVDRLQESARFMFETAEHPEMVDVVERWTVSTLKELKGVDRTRPFGMMLYLRSGFVGTPIGITYVPITNLDDALATLAYGVGTVSPVEGKRNYNDIRYGENFKIRTRQVGGYLFMVGPDDEGDTLDKVFPDPIKLSSRLSSQYDVAISLQIKNIPPTVKSIFLEYLKMSSQAELQQRDDEPESAYRLRRANGDSWLELADRVVTQGEEFTIGGKMDTANRKAHIDFEIVGTSDSKLAKFFQDMVGKRTYFGNLLPNPSTFTMSASWLLSDKQRPLLTSFFDAAKRDAAKVAEKNNVQGINKLLDPLFKVLLASADVGHVDLIAQLVGTEPQKFALIAGARVVGSRNLPKQITDLLQFVKDNPNGNDLVTKLEIGANEIDSLPVHRLEINPPDKPGQRMFGETAHLYLYASPQALWFAFGGDSAMDNLRDAVTQVAAPQDPQQGRNRIPFMFVTHASNWLTVASDERPRAAEFNEQARASFKSENDSMQILVRPTDSGVRTRIEFEEGYIALMGRGITKGVETGAFDGSQRRRERQKQQEDARRREELNN